MADDLAPIIVKKIKKGGHGAHGGAWKVAYADFVTAMMAFFLLLWLLNVTTTEQKEGLADYFAPTTASLSQSGAGGVMGGTSMQTEGAQISNLGVPSAVSSISPPDNGRKGESEDARKTREMEEAELLEKLRKIEEASFEQARDQIRQAINKDPELSGLKDNIIIDMTPEGLRIQIVDQFNESMFESGSSNITPRIQSLVGKIAKSIEELPNSLSISGHTDSSSFNGGDYSNWELSSDRANASRRALLDAGLKPDRIEKVAGRADTDPLIADDPSNPGNRRISIILLRETPVLPPNLK
ncbi:flagellar motor protein MotB [Sneathiella sp. HT1-7]|uniref:flagellar motor protein MotB n=1 Tax=Sneathiella sp. HT1-7 TaxID=2887192 RepID=UPI001D159476|nr:flagellar motor protein MotB [Sneathiella sp. HT1-7]MCC3304741.1 flagellar motor protein MotB [Sneathiella sp. HT1-7]